MTDYELFTADFFAANRRSLQDRAASGVPIVVTANGLLQRGADSSYQFSQDANFWYLTGIDEPDITLVMNGDEEFLIVPGREATRQTFDGAIDADELARVSGVQRIVDDTAGWKHLDQLMERGHRVCMPTPAPVYLQAYGMYSNPARLRVLERMQQHVADLEVIDIRAELAVLRMIKQPAELTALRQAISITADSLNDALAPARLRRQKHEYQLEAEIFRGFRSRGASGHSFEPIVAGGKNAVTLHNVANDSSLTAGELVVCDVGAEYSHYAADITRTVAYGKPSDRQQAIYEAVARVQTFALTLLKPGCHLKTFEDKVARQMGQELKELGLINRLTKENVRRYFPHATTHYLGLNVHDVGDYTLPLKPGVVLTCEPGLYVPEEGIGVRIEDDVLITESGNEVLSAACRKELGSLH